MNPKRVEECVGYEPMEPTVGQLINELENQQEEIEKLIYGVREKLDNSPEAPTEGGTSVDTGYVNRLKSMVRKNENLINDYLIQISEML